MAKKVSDLIVERLIEWGVDTIFGLPGDGVDGFFEALRTHKDKIKFIQVRHEESAAFCRVRICKIHRAPRRVLRDLRSRRHPSFEWSLRRQVRSPAGAGYYRPHFSRSYRYEAEQVLREALNYRGPTVVQGVVDPEEPPVPGKVTTEQAIHFAEALLRGQKDAMKILKTVALDEAREVV